MEVGTSDFPRSHYIVRVYGEEVFGARGESRMDLFVQYTQEIAVLHG